jgi:hypothetical protein
MVNYDTQLYRGTKEGSINPELLISYIYRWEDNPDDFPTLRLRKNGGLSINPSFSISISEGFDKPRIFLPGVKYYAFVSLLDKAVTNIQENLFKLFPNISSTEFEVDSRALEIFQTEKAFTTAGMTAVPAVWTNATSECFPGVKITSKNGYVTIPLEDAIPIVLMLKNFDPIVYSISMLEFFGEMPKGSTKSYING